MQEKSSVSRLEWIYNEIIVATQHGCFLEGVGPSSEDTEGNGPAKSVSNNPNRTISYSKIWIFENKMNIPYSLG